MKRSNYWMFTHGQRTFDIRDETIEFYENHILDSFTFDDDLTSKNKIFSYIYTTKNSEDNKIIEKGIYLIYNKFIMLIPSITETYITNDQSIYVSGGVKKHTLLNTKDGKFIFYLNRKQ